MSIGGNRSFVRFHRHEENWLAGISGRKHWMVFPPARGTLPP